jgi:TIR domain
MKEDIRPRRLRLEEENVPGDDVWSEDQLHLAPRIPRWDDRVVPKQIFVSYSHEDDEWRARLLQALAPIARADEIDVWDDRNIAPGERWAERIEEQIARSNVAVLLVSASFLASQYIADVEVPRIVAAARSGRLTVVWVPVSASMWDVTELASFQAAIDPRTPLDSMSPPRASEALVAVARKIAAGRTLTDLGSAMQVIDATYDELTDEVGPHRVVARHTGSTVTFEARDTATPVEVITSDELANLPDDQHRLIQALEQGMRDEYERWTTLRPRRSTMTTREHADYEAAGRRMCDELGHILDFIEVELGKHLQDHYSGIRYACGRLIGSGS